MRRLSLVVLLSVVWAISAHAQTPSETPTDTPTPTVTPTSTRTPTATSTPTYTAGANSTRTPRSTAVPATAIPQATATPGSYSHVTALELTLLTKDADWPRYSADCIAQSYPTGPYESLCRCVLYVKRVTGVDYFAFKCPAGVEHIVDEVRN